MQTQAQRLATHPLGTRLARLRWVGLTCCVLSFFSISVDSAHGAFRRTTSTTQEIIAHAKVGDAVEFTPVRHAKTLTLQGLSPETGRWSNLTTSQRPQRTLKRLAIPEGWRDAELRVVTTYAVGTTRRVKIRSKIDASTRSVTFTPTAGATLFSIESKTQGASAWSRVRTVPASSVRKSLVIALPDSVESDAAIRVMAVYGTRPQASGLASAVDASLRTGPTVFSPTASAVSSSPVVMSDSGMTKEGGTETTANSTEESDVWKIRGSRIHFFNHLRGLQIFEVSDPSSPMAAGSLPMAASGEEMYLIGPDPERADAVLLLANVPWSPSSPEATRVLRVGLEGDTPAVESQLDIPGYYVDSRLTGNRLHLVTASWSTETGEWNPRTFVTTIDVSQKGVLESLSSRSHDFICSQAGATKNHLWLASNAYYYGGGQQLIAYPFASDGSLGEPMQTGIGGIIQDKFKVGDTADGLAVVVQNWVSWSPVTSVETYSAASGSLVKQSSLELVRGETLYATRFNGNRLYAVTFLQVDPLWIVDLSNPEDPQITGHLEIPGWSTHIQPVDDVLIAVGRDADKLQISMFDVSDPAAPSLAQRVDVAQSWAWSEAEWNEKAVSILPESGLILLPVLAWENGARSNRVSLVDFDTAGRRLTMRGTIAHDFAPRRAALMENGVIASVSNRQLLLVDASDRDAPRVTADELLAFGADRVLVRDGVALMIENGSVYGSSSLPNAVLRTAPASDPDADAILGQIELPCASVAAAGIFEDRLVLVENPDSHGFYWKHSRTDGDDGGSAVSVWSLEDPANPALLGRSALPFRASMDVSILAVEGSRLAITSREQGWGYWIRPLPTIDLPAIRTASVARDFLPSIHWGGQGLKLAIVEISDGLPQVTGSWRLEGVQCSGISEVFAAGDLLAFSYDRQETIRSQGKQPLWNEEWSGVSARTLLQIIDLADPSSPAPWAPVQLPGRMLGLSWLQRSGGVLYAASEGRVAAMGFDGEAASVIAEIPAGPAQVIHADTLYSAGETGLEEWSFSQEAGCWSLMNTWDLESKNGVQSLHFVAGRLVVQGRNQIWTLGDDRSLGAHDTPVAPNPDKGSGDASSLLVPLGEYGVQRLPLD